MIFKDKTKGFVKFYIDFPINCVRKGISTAFRGLGRLTSFCHPGSQVAVCLPTAHSHSVKCLPRLRFFEIVEPNELYQAGIRLSQVQVTLFACV